MHEAFEEIPCNLCGSFEATEVFASTLPADLSLALTKRFAPADHASGHDRIIRCTHCGLVFSNPRIKREYIWQGYSDAVDMKYATQSEERMDTFKCALKKIEKYCPKRGRMLDVGCAAGFFLKVAKEAGWEAYGIEPNKGLAQFGAERYGVHISSKDFLESDFAPRSFQVITFWDVLEHVTDPSAYVRRAFELLAPGGYLFVNFPDFGSRLARWTGEKWWFLSPVHIFYFDRRTLRSMLEKCGFSLDRAEMHWQTLTLGYLFERFSDYNKFISRLGRGVCSFLGIGKLPVRYYAAQALAIAHRPSKL